MLASTSLRRFAALPVSLLLAAGVVVATPQAADAGSGKTTPKVKKAVKVAKAQKGDPYSYGATGPHSFDCSGLTSFAFRKAGITLPRTSGAQASKARKVSRNKMRRGDLVFFHSGGSVYHVGIYWGWNNGNRLILDAPRPGQKVGFSKIWTNSWFPGRVGPKHQPKKIKKMYKSKSSSAAKRLTSMRR